MKFFNGKKISVAHLSFSSSGGAGKVAGLLNEALVYLGHDSHHYFATTSDLRTKPLENFKVTINSAIDEFIVKKKNNDSTFSLFRDRISSIDFSNLANRQILHLHWINGLIDLKTILSNQMFDNTKIVITLHDMNMMTGGCHHSGDCNKFVDFCSKCPMTKKIFNNKIQNSFEEKLNFFASRKQLNVVAPSTWMQEKATRSRMFNEIPIFKIPNPVEKVFFTENSFSDSRNNLGESLESIVLFAVATDLDNPNKGIDNLVWWFKSFKQEFFQQNLKLFLIGKNGKKFENIPGVKLLGELTSKEISQIGPAANFLILLSNSENAPLVIAEFGAMGVPTIAYDIGGIKDMMALAGKGFLIRSPNEIQEIITSTVLFNPDNYFSIREKILRTSQKSFNIENTLNKYLEIYT